MQGNVSTLPRSISSPNRTNTENTPLETDLAVPNDGFDTVDTQTGGETREIGDVMLTNLFGIPPAQENSPPQVSGRSGSGAEGSEEVTYPYAYIVWRYYVAKLYITDFLGLKHRLLMRREQMNSWMVKGMKIRLLMRLSQYRGGLVCKLKILQLRPGEEEGEGEGDQGRPKKFKTSGRNIL